MLQLLYIAVSFTLFVLCTHMYYTFIQYLKSQLTLRS